MPKRRRLRKEEEEKLQLQKKSLKKSFQKSYSGSKRIGSKRLSDTKKYALIAAVAIVIIIILAVQFLVPPEPICYYTEADFVHATLDQGTQTISFDRIIAWYYLKAEHATVNCDIDDYYNDTYDLELPPASSHLTSSVAADQILYSVTEVTSVLLFETVMENSTVPLQMSTWVNLTIMNTTPSSISSGVETEVNFRLEIVTSVAVDHYNISLDFNQNLAQTTLTYVSIAHGTPNVGELLFYTRGGSLSADSSIILDFTLTVNSSLSGSLNLLEEGEIHLVLDNQLLESSYSDFKESEVTFTYGMEQRPRLEKTKFLDIVVDIPYYNITSS
ncbi:MAG: hypothetical protein HWN66_09295 [Candidatus Helarchaeota archaeon]|nr:hypothetical protein [Candidatus Helarchaeota archaeon]